MSSVPSPNNSTTTNYGNWSKTLLIQKIQHLESQLSKLNPDHSDRSGNPDNPDNQGNQGKTEEANPSKKRRIKEFDFNKYPKQRIALHLAYVGTNYHGLACAGYPETLPTIEGELFRALLKTRLIESIPACGYNRCGRTDRGVSARKQIVSLIVRADPSLNYASILNRQLDANIKVFAWSIVPDSFNARFDCTWREYRYYFPLATAGISMDLERIKQACTKLLGEHDWRNFCKIDDSKPDMHFVRRVDHCEVVSPVAAMVEVVIKGSGFLWHHIRHIMAVLFLIGQGLEEPRVIDELLDISLFPSRPVYEMASERGLVLFDCGFKTQFNWTSADLSTFSSTEIREQALMDWTVKEKVFPTTTAEEEPEKVKGKTPVYLGGGRIKWEKAYVPLKQRARCKIPPFLKEKE